MAQVQLVELNHRHMAIAEYLLANPSARLKEIAAAVGMSVSWVSIVTNSEVFREYLQQRNREIADTIHLSLQEKVVGIAHRAVEKLGDAVDDSQDPAFILAVADKTLGRLGYGAKGAQVNVQAGGPLPAASTHTHVDITVINQAREKVYALAGHGRDNAQNPAAPARLPANIQTDRVGTLIDGAGIFEKEEAQGPKSAGD
jgi:hypothetical protein